MGRGTFKVYVYVCIRVYGCMYGVCICTCMCECVSVYACGSSFKVQTRTSMNAEIRSLNASNLTESLSFIAVPPPLDSENNTHGEGEDAQNPLFSDASS